MAIFQASIARAGSRCVRLSSPEIRSAIRAETTLQPFEIDAVADYVATKIKGAGPVTRAECTEFFGETGAECDKYPEK